MLQIIILIVCILIIEFILLYSAFHTGYLNGLKDSQPLESRKEEEIVYNEGTSSDIASNSSCD